jgi:hypothetical protein
MPPVNGVVDTGEDQRLIAQTVWEFAEAEIRPYVRQWDEVSIFRTSCCSVWAPSGLRE